MNEGQVVGDGAEESRGSAVEEMSDCQELHDALTNMIRVIGKRKLSKQATQNTISEFLSLYTSLKHRLVS